MYMCRYIYICMSICMYVCMYILVYSVHNVHVVPELGLTTQAWKLQRSKLRKYIRRGGFTSTGKYMARGSLISTGTKNMARGGLITTGKNITRSDLGHLQVVALRLNGYGSYDITALHDACTFIMYVCMYVCMSVCTYVCLYVCMYAYILYSVPGERHVPKAQQHRCVSWWRPSWAATCFGHLRQNSYDMAKAFSSTTWFQHHHL